MADALIFQAMKKLPDWMVDVSERFDEVVNRKESGILLWIYHVQMLVVELLLRC